MKRLLTASLLVSSLTVMADTYDYSKKWGIGGSFGYNTPIFGHTFNTEADGGETWGAHLRYHTCKSCGFELAFTKHEFSDVMPALQVTDLTWFMRLKPLERLTPVVGAGVGVVDVTNYDPNSLKMGLKLRGGMEYALCKELSLGLNLDYQQVTKMLFGDNHPGRNIHALAARLGLTWYFGGAEKVAAVTAVVASAMDKDSDNDGVMDKKDKCLNSAAGTKVNAYGCAVEEKAEVHLDVHFATGKASIAPGYDAQLKELADFMVEHPTTKIEVQGHTDSSGSKVANKKLSQARADAVKNYLITNLKVDGSRVTAKGFGDEQPIADNKSADGKEKNRRVVAVITE